MKKLPVLALLFALSFGFALTVYAQSADDRKANILANLKYQFPQLREVEVVMGPLEMDAINGLDLGSFVINGRQTQFLVNSDNTKLYLIAGGPFDVSRPKEELDALFAEEDRAAAQDALEKHTQLQEAIAGMPYRGNPDADVTIIEFSDFQCPYCARGSQIVEELLAKHGDEIKFVYLHLPLNMHPWAEPAAVASVCAAEQDQEVFWSLHDWYFANQQALDLSNVIEKTRDFLADSALDLDQWSTCASDEASEAHMQAKSVVEDNVAIAQQLNITGTPGFFVNGYFINGAKPLATFEEAINKAKRNLQ